MKYIAEIVRATAQPGPAKYPGRCQYDWCTHPRFKTDESDIIVHAQVLGFPAGNMHVSHTTLAPQYNGGLTEYYDDGGPDNTPTQETFNPQEWFTQREMLTWMQEHPGVDFVGSYHVSPPVKDHRYRLVPK